MTNPKVIWKLKELGGWSCNCPDWSKSEPLNPRSQDAGRKANRAWTDSKAGSPGDCKHIMAVREMRSEVDPEEEYADMATPEWARKEQVYQVPRSNGSSGDNFGFSRIKGW